jgi:anti-sigma28 factor (negative regulator of flagellin synthesis)
MREKTIVVSLRLTKGELARAYQVLANIQQTPKSISDILKMHLQRSIAMIDPTGNVSSTKKTKEVIDGWSRKQQKKRREKKKGIHLDIIQSLTQYEELDKVIETLPSEMRVKAANIKSNIQSGMFTIKDNLCADNPRLRLITALLYKNTSFVTGDQELTSLIKSILTGG